MAAPRKQFAKIYDQFIDKIYRFIFIKVSSREIAEDLTSETFARVWEVFKHNSAEIKNIQAFLYQVARNLVTDHYREKARARFVSAESIQIIDPEVGVEEKFQLASDLERMRELLASLREDYQSIIIWHYLDGLSIPEIAKMLKKSEDAVKIQLYRAVRALREQF